jgi:hypothetical protein
MSDQAAVKIRAARIVLSEAQVWKSNHISALADVAYPTSRRTIVKKKFAILQISCLRRFATTDR